MEEVIFKVTKPGRRRKSPKAEESVGTEPSR